MPYSNGRRRRAVPAPAPLDAPLSRRSLPRDPVALARWLIGKRLVRSLEGVKAGGRIVETEAYLHDDPASHSFRGESLRNRSMFGVRGNAYVYRIYGMWFCFNVSAGAPLEGAAVLIRAIEPEFGLDAMAARRGGAGLRDLTRGPGRLCAALDIDLRLDGIDLCRANGALWLSEGGAPVGRIATSPRIGITKAADAPLRFYERGNVQVSGSRNARS